MPCNLHHNKMSAAVGFPAALCDAENLMQLPAQASPSLCSPFIHLISMVSPEFPHRCPYFTPQKVDPKTLPFCSRNICLYIFKIIKDKKPSDKIVSIHRIHIPRCVSITLPKTIIRE